MPGISDMRELYKVKGKELLDDLFSKYVVVSEKIDGTSIYVRKIKTLDNKGYEIKVYKGNSDTPITFVDRVYAKYYENAVTFFSGLDSSIIDNMPENWKFGFQYFSDTSPGNIIYDDIPKNNLVITHIIVVNESNKKIKVIDEPTTLSNWSSMLDVDGPPVIFKGYLNETQKDKILTYLSTDEEDIVDMFGTTSFTNYLIGILNPKLKKTFLNKDLIKPIDSIVFNIYGTDEKITAKIVDSYTQHIKDKSLKKSEMDTYSLVILDILEYIERHPDVFKVKLMSDTPDKRYVEFISDLFKRYIISNKSKLKQLEFDIPEFARKHVYDINKDLIVDDKVKELLDERTNEIIFKILLNSFRIFRKKITDILTQPVLSLMNRIIRRIKELITVNISTNEENEFKSFEDYLLMKETTDSLFDEEEVLEDLKVKYLDKGKKKVNIVVGRFQPFTLGHYKIVNKLYLANKLDCVILIVRGKKDDLLKRPLSEKIQSKMMENIKREYPHIIDFVFIRDSAAINVLFDHVRPNYEPILWGVGADRVESYASQIRKYSPELNVDPGFKILPIKRDSMDISATVVRNAIMSNDIETFKPLVPESTHQLYDTYKEALEKAKTMVGVDKYIKYNKKLSTK